MKKWSFLFVLTALCLLLGACDPGFYTVDQEELKQVVSVELIQYGNPEQKHFSSWVPDQFKKLVSFDAEKATVLETLPADKIPEFLDAFSEAEILHTYYAYNSPRDICLRLNYENGDFLIAWANYAEGSYAGYIGEYSSSGTVLSFWGSFCSLPEYKSLVNDYFTQSLT